MDEGVRPAAAPPHLTARLYKYACLHSPLCSCYLVTSFQSLCTKELYDQQDFVFLLPMIELKLKRESLKGYFL